MQRWRQKDIEQGGLEVGHEETRRLYIDLEFIGADRNARVGKRKNTME
jgi:hypothetical protein